MRASRRRTDDPTPPPGAPRRAAAGTRRRTPRRSPRHARVVAGTVLVAAPAGACANDGTRGAPSRPTTLDVDLVAALQPFDACDDFLDHVHRIAREQVSAYGLGAGEVMPMTRDGVVSSEAKATAGGADAAAPAAPASSAAERSSDSAGGTGTGTNNQEADVDEADLVKVAGDRVVTVRGAELIVVTMRDGAPHVTGRVSLGDQFSGDRLFVVGDRAYVFGWDGSATAGEDTTSRRFATSGSSALVEVSLAEATPKVAHRAIVGGSVLDGRLIDGVLRLVVTSPGGTGLGFVYPDGNAAAEGRALEVNRNIVEDSTVDDWLPQVQIDGTRRRLVPCEQALRPAEPSGLSMLSIVTITDGLTSMSATGVLADGQITYASSKRLYVATNQWTVPEQDERKIAPGSFGGVEHTDVHAFSIAGSEPATYEASGRVEGHVLNQYSMSESGDDLRIATTTSATGDVMPMPAVDCPPNAEGAARPQPAASSTGESRIVVLRRDGTTLREIGKVGGLGPSEQIKSVRYVGDLAYVVTFRRTDPFYVVSLADPTSPKVLGELKVPGFSSYLHPVGDRLVLGVGSDATDAGRVTGAKLSLYDTSDPLAPRELDTWTSTEMTFRVDGDPHAFLWDAERSTAVLPYWASCLDAVVACDGSGGALVVRIADGSITEVGRIDHRDRTPSPEPAPEPSPPTTVQPPEPSPTTTVPVTTTTVAVDPTTTVAPDAPVARDDSSSSSTSSSAGVAAPVQTVPCDPASCDPFPGPMTDPWPVDTSISRAFLVGDRLVTLSNAGVAAHDIGDLRRTGYAPF